MANYRFSLDGGDITSISPGTWEKLNLALVKALEEAGADGVTVNGFQMPDEAVLAAFDEGGPGSNDRVMFSEQVDGP